jgi:cobalt-zinc-cadmium efflux system protein
LRDADGKPPHGGSNDPRAHDHGHGRDHDHTHDHTHGRDHDHGGDHDRAPHADGHGHGHGHDHGHGHAHGHVDRAAGARRLSMLLALVVAYIGVEVAGGLASGSLALLADAGHMVSDAAALAVTLVALRLAERPATPQRTYGWHRAEILAAALNGAALLLISGGVLYEAWERLRAPPPVAGPLMMGVAAGGLVVNLIGLALLHARREDSLNLRGAWLHVLSDALGSLAALTAGGLAWGLGWTLADPVASVIIALLVLRGAWRLMDDAVHVLMEGAPPHIDVEAVRAALAAVPGVVAVHDLHVWTITSGMICVSVHVVVPDGAADGCKGPQRQREADAGPELLHRLSQLLRARFGIAHATIQIEPPGFEESDLHP